MKRRDLLRWAALAPVATAAAPMLAKAGTVVARVASRVPRIEWVFEADGLSKTLLIDHAAVATIPRGVQLTAEGMARYVAQRAEIARLAAEAVRR